MQPTPRHGPNDYVLNLEKRTNWVDFLWTRLRPWRPRRRLRRQIRTTVRYKEFSFFFSLFCPFASLSQPWYHDLQWFAFSAALYYFRYTLFQLFSLRSFNHKIFIFPCSRKHGGENTFFFFFSVPCSTESKKNTNPNRLNLRMHYLFISCVPNIYPVAHSNRMYQYPTSFLPFHHLLLHYISNL